MTPAHLLIEIQRPFWIQVCSNEGSRPFPKGDNNKRVKIY